MLDENSILYIKAIMSVCPGPETQISKKKKHV
jgi:hypothetical protein